MIEFMGLKGWEILVGLIGTISILSFLHLIIKSAGNWMDKKLESKR